MQVVTWEEDPAERLASMEYRTAVDDYMTAEVLPVRARRLGRPQQDQDRLRDPAHAALLQVRAAAPLAEIDAEIKELEGEIQELLREVTE